MSRIAGAGRSWRVAYTSQSLTGVLPAVDAGLTITVVARSMLTPDLFALDDRAGLPPLPSVEIAMHRPSGRPAEPARRRAALIQEQLGEG